MSTTHRTMLTAALALLLAASATAPAVAAPVVFPTGDTVTSVDTAGVLAARAAFEALPTSGAIHIPQLVKNMVQGVM